VQIFQTPGTWVLLLFAVSWTSLCALASYLLWDGSISGLWLLPLGMALFFGRGIFVPAIMLPSFRLVDRLLAPIGRLFALLMLIIVYFGVFSPFALALRLIGWDPLRLRRHEQKHSAWVKRSTPETEADYFWQY
jgi:hypothetical protein